jgi:hypothetical protein
MMRRRSAGRHWPLLENVAHKTHYEGQESGVLWALRHDKLLAVDRCRFFFQDVVCTGNDNQVYVQAKLSS